MKDFQYYPVEGLMENELRLAFDQIDAGSARFGYRTIYYQGKWHVIVYERQLDYPVQLSPTLERKISEFEDTVNTLLPAAQEYSILRHRYSCPTAGMKSKSLRILVCNVRLHHHKPSQRQTLRRSDCIYH